ncbi:hypothetical protein MPSEU_000387100 [Mayamaea pseudoterrestris]|nr:hypothetical protein MPSEU_000387100 [Mayamaea pseudoterrestris]
MCSDASAAAQGCAFFSATGIIFMTWVGIMLMKQPFFVGGIEDVEAAKGSAFGAAGTFFFTFLISMMYMIREGQRLTRSNNSGGSVNSYDDPIQGVRRHPFFDQPGTTALFHDYDPVDSTISVPGREMDRSGVFT